MNKKIIAIILTLILLLLISCKQKDVSVQEQKTENQQPQDMFDTVLNGQTVSDIPLKQQEIIPAEEPEQESEEYAAPFCGDDICTYYETYSSCPEDCTKLEDTTLNDYPDFLDDPILVVGDDAPATDVITATVISTYLVANDITPTTKLASEITSFTADDLILIGSPCENYAIARLLHYTSEICTVVESMNNAVIKLLVNPTNEIIIITGYDNSDTKDASKMLTDMGNTYNLNGAEEWVNLDSNGNINMYFSKN